MCESTICAHDFRESVSRYQQPIDTAVLFVLGDDTSIDLRQTLDLNVRNRPLEIFEPLIRSISLVEVLQRRFIDIDPDS